MWGLMSAAKAQMIAIAVEKLLGGSVQKIRAFWDEMCDHPAYAIHPMHRHVKSHKQWAIPAKMHGDGTMTSGVGKSWAKMGDAISWSSCLLESGPTKTGNYIMVLMLECLNAIMNGVSRTEAGFWNELCWSLYWAYQGQHPDRDANHRW